MTSKIQTYLLLIVFFVTFPSVVSAKSKNRIDLRTTNSSATNQAPVFDPFSTYELGLGQSKYIVIGATDAEGDSMTLTVSGNNVEDFGILTEKPGRIEAWVRLTGNVSGTTPVHYHVKDHHNGSSQAFVAINVVEDPDNHPIRFGTIQHQSIIKGYPLSIDVIAYDHDSEGLDLNAHNLPNNASFTVIENRDGYIAGRLQWTPTIDDLGVHTITFFSNDTEPGRNNQASARAQIIVTNNTEINTPPVFDPIQTYQIGAGETQYVVIGATDLEYQPMEFHAAGAHVQDYGILINEPGRLEAWVQLTGASGEGMHEISYSVKDINGTGPDAHTILQTPITVSSDPDNHPVKIDHVQHLSIKEGYPLRLNIIAQDLDPETLQLSATIPENATFDIVENKEGYVSAKIKWTPTSDQLGLHDITIVAEDAEPTRHNSAFATFRVAVLNTPEINTPPIFDPISTYQIGSGETQYVVIGATDAEEQSMQFRASGPHVEDYGILRNEPGRIEAWVQLTGTSGDGLHDVSYSVNDNNGTGPDAFSVVKSQLMVTEDPDNHSIQMGTTQHQTIAAGYPLSIGVLAYDLDPETLDMSAIIPENATFDIINTKEGYVSAKIKWTPTADQLGLHDLTILAKDAEPARHNSALATFRVAVIDSSEVNTAPVFDPISTYQLGIGETQHVIIGATDLEKQPMHFHASGPHVEDYGILVNEPGRIESWVQLTGTSGSSIHDVIYSVNDINGIGPNAYTVAQTPIQVVDEPDNYPIEFEPIVHREVTAGQKIKSILSINDLDGENLDMFAITPEGSSFKVTKYSPISITPPDKTNRGSHKKGSLYGLFSWAPTLDQIGLHDIIIFAKEKEGGRHNKAIGTLRINVKE